MTGTNSTRQPLAGLAPALILETLLSAADAAARETLPRFRKPLDVENKLAVGFDPVTEADKQAEIAVRDLIAARFPDHGLIGEEWDPKLSDTPCQWIIDPIDGTRAFISGVPVWGTLIGFMVDGRAEAGLMDQPFTGETYVGLPGRSTYRRGAEEIVLKTSTVTEIARAKLSTTAPDLFTQTGTERQWSALRSRALQTRYGLDCYAYCLLAAGHIDLVVEPGLKNVDIAPLVPIIENAGGIVTTWDGGAAEEGGNCIAAATPELHAAAMAILKSA